nr:LPD7 domain-containing protein [Photobacterium carnosum]
MKTLYFNQERIKPEPTLTIEPAKTKEIKQGTSNEKPQSPSINNKTIQPDIPINNELKYRPIKHDFNHQGFGDIHYKENDKNKHITYFEKTLTENGKDKFNKLIIDRGDNIKVIDKSEKSIEMALLLSIEKYGNELDIKGSEQYKDQVINIIAKNNLDITLTDKTMMDKLIERQQDYQRVDDLIQAKQETYEPQQPQQQVKSTPDIER